MKTVREAFGPYWSRMDWREKLTGARLVIGFKLFNAVARWGTAMAYKHLARFEPKE